MGWVLYEMRRTGSMRGGVMDGLIMGIVLWLILFPVTAAGVLFRLTGFHEMHGTLEVAAELLIALCAGLFSGWMILRGWRTAISIGVAGLTVTVVSGGPIPVANSVRAAGLFLSFGLLLPVCGLVVALFATLGVNNQQHLTRDPLRS